MDNTAIQATSRTIDSSANQYMISPSTFRLLLCLIVLSPIFRGGNRSTVLFFLEILTLILMAATAYQSLKSQQLPSLPGSRLSRFIFLLLLTSPLFSAAVHFVVAPTFGLPVTTFTASAHSYLASLPILCCLFLSALATESQATTLYRTWIFLAVAEATMGLLQIGTGEVLRFGIPSNSPITGTFASKNTYANLLVMAIPLATAGWFKAFSANNHRTAPRGNVQWAWGAALFILMVTVLLTTSRTGIVTGLLVFVMSVLLLSPRDRSSRWGGWFWSAGALALAVIALLAGGLDWVSRFDADTLSNDYDVRALMRSATASAAWSNLPFGLGLGSFPWVSSTFQPPEMGPYWFDLAHNDYLQLFAETGLVGAVLVAASIWLFLSKGWVALRLASSRTSSSTREAKAALAGGIGLLAFAVHAWVDYPFHIPANAMMAATLLGLLCREIPGTTKRTTAK